MLLSIVRLLPMLTCCSHASVTCILKSSVAFWGAFPAVDVGLLDGSSACSLCMCQLLL